MTIPSYSIAIRTLGTAGEKYQRELDSIARQTLQPDKIVVYIPHGYDLPKETIGREQFAHCDKGMIAQRAVKFNEIDSEYILLLDDDIELGDDVCEKLMADAVAADADCVALNIYKHHENGIKDSVINWLVNSIPHHDRNWAIKIGRSSHFRYNPNPFGMMRTMSGAGGAILVRKSAILAIHFEDERWLDFIPYAFMEDQLFVYKFYKYGFRTYMHYGVNVNHLDARSSHSRDIKKKAYVSKMNRYIVWHRSIFSTQKSSFGKLYAWIAYWSSELYTLLVSPIFCLKWRGVYPMYQVFTSNIGGVKYCNSKEYKNLNPYMKWANIE